MVMRRHGGAGPVQTSQMQTSMYANMPWSHPPQMPLQPQSAPHAVPVQRPDGSTYFSTISTPYPMPATIPGVDVQQLLASAQSTADAHRIFQVSSVRNDEIASRGPNPFATDCVRPWGGNPGMKPYMVPPTMQQPAMRPMSDPQMRPPIIPQAPGRLQGKSSPLKCLGVCLWEVGVDTACPHMSAHESCKYLCMPSQYASTWCTRWLSDDPASCRPAYGCSLIPSTARSRGCFSCSACLSKGR